MNNVLINRQTGLSCSSKKQRYLDKTFLIYAACTFFYFIRMFYLNLPVGIICGLVTLFLSFSIVSITLNFRKNNSTIDFLVYIYIFWNLFSIIHYLYNGIPISVFFSDALSSFLPIIFYFHAKSPNREKTYSWYCLITSAITIVGILLFFTLPSFYTNFLKYTDVSGRFMAEAYSRNGRLSSIYNSTIIGILCCYSVAISLYELLFKKKKIYFFYLLVNLLGVFLCYQRSTIVVTILLLLVYFILMLFDKKIKAGYKIRVVLFFMLFSILAFIGLQYLSASSQTIDFGRYIEQFFERLNSMDGAVSERSSTWIAALSFPKNIVLGSGLGSVGHQAIQYNSLTVRDGNLIKIICELGLIGFLLFIILMITVVVKGLKKHCYCEVAIVAVGLLHCIGSNGLALFISSFLFWYAIGLISNNDSYRRSRLNENNRCNSCSL